MTKFLGVYRGAAIYEVEQFESSEGKKIGSKILAKAMLPDQPNMQVDFVEKAESLDKARKKIKKSIDRYLNEHDMDQFKIDIL